MIFCAAMIEWENFDFTSHLQSFMFEHIFLFPIMAARSLE